MTLKNELLIKILLNDKKNKKNCKESSFIW